MSEPSMSALQSVLKWTLSQQSESDGTGHDGSVVENMTQERRAFLEKVFSSIGQNETAAMKDAMEVLTGSDTTEGAHASKLAALENLQECIEDLDNAGDLATMGGLMPVAAALKSPWPDVRCAAGEVIATAAQNNPRVQEYMVQVGVMDLLFEMMEDPDVLVRTKAVRGISGIIRGHAVLTEEFARRNGPAKLMDMFKSAQGHLKLSTKCAFLASTVATHNRSCIDAFVSYDGCVNIVLCTLEANSKVDSSHGLFEHCFQFLIALASTCISEATKTRISNILIGRRKHLSALDAGDREASSDEVKILTDVEKLFS